MDSPVARRVRRIASDDDNEDLNDVSATVDITPQSRPPAATTPATDEDDGLFSEDEQPKKTTRSASRKRYPLH